LSLLLELPRPALTSFLSALPQGEPLTGPLLPPIEAGQEVWASGVTYLRSREARQAESEVADVYGRVYEAARPELFFKALGWRVVGPERPIRIRRDSNWNVPEPELTLVINRHLEIVGFCAGNDVSSRDIEGENPLYLPQAKSYNQSCAIGPAIRLAEAGELADVPIQLDIQRGGQSLFAGEIRSSQMKRSLEELVSYLGRELDFPNGVFLMTGTGLVPGDDFTLQAGDRVTVTVHGLALVNEVVQGP
jgi:2-dehydro-3-deoxy-D-arabinonate dehydratase